MLKKLSWGIFAGACLLAVCAYLLWPSSATPVAPVDHQAFRTIEWTDLMPESDLQAILNAPEVTHDGEEELYSMPMQGLLLDEYELDESPEVDEATSAFQEALVSAKVRPEFDGQRIRIPGFMVPIQLDGPKNVTEFFLVPYFGACIHTPPPPPNQIIHVEHPQGFHLDDLFTPVWVVGTAHTINSTKSSVQSAYSMSEVDISLYYDSPE
ncbi:MAG: DUF3299 domain-containing protein [Porticoccaceae bacterium]|nr:DUF3299 domain-containing protein [Porticoccaceae bacterium]